MLCTKTRYISAERWLVWRLSTCSLSAAQLMYISNHPASSVASFASVYRDLLLH